MFFLAWVDKGTAFDPDVHNVEDEAIYTFDVTQAEGEYATLSIEIDNPGEGLLSPGRKQWAWFSWDKNNGSPASPLFYGRLDAAPDDIHAETIRIELIGEPDDIAAQKEALAATLRQQPYWDEAWIQEDATNPDAVLETRTAHWDTDRLTHVLSVVDILSPGGSVIEITENDHFYDAMTTSKNGDKPLKRVIVKATGKWNQKATGTVDITEKVWKAAQASGSPFNFPVIGSFTSQGLAADYPEPLKNLGGGWVMGANSHAEVTAFVQTGSYVVKYIDKTDNNAEVDPEAAGPNDNQSIPFVPSNSFLQSQYGNPGLAPISLFDTNWTEWFVAFPLYPVDQKLTLDYSADRERSEFLTFTIAADVQSLYAEPGDDEEEIIELSSEFLDQPVDPGGALPIGDLRLNCYFPTDRGQVSLQYFLLLARARLVFRARAFIIEFETPIELLADIISCRRQILLHDHRLPGGQALGKVISYSLLGSADSQTAKVSIGCAIGKGIALPAASDEGDTYAEDYADDYTELIALTIDVLTGELQYDGFDETIVIDDDGVDFLNMTPDRILLEPVTIANGLNDQQALLDASVSDGITDPDPIGTLKDNPTKIRFKLVPVVGGAFLSEYDVTVAPLVIPKMIDLEAA